MFEGRRRRWCFSKCRRHLFIGRGRLRRGRWRRHRWSGHWWCLSKRWWLFGECRGSLLENRGRRSGWRWRHHPGNGRRSRHLGKLALLALGRLGRALLCHLDGLLFGSLGLLLFLGLLARWRGHRPDRSSELVVSYRCSGRWRPCHRWGLWRHACRRVCRWRCLGGHRWLHGRWWCHRWSGHWRCLGKRRWRFCECRRALLVSRWRCHRWSGHWRCLGKRRWRFCECRRSLLENRGRRSGWRWRDRRCRRFRRYRCLGWSCRRHLSHDLRADDLRLRLGLRHRARGRLQPFGYQFLEICCGSGHDRAGRYLYSLQVRRCGGRLADLEPLRRGRSRRGRGRSLYLWWRHRWCRDLRWCDLRWCANRRRRFHLFLTDHRRPVDKLTRTRGPARTCGRWRPSRCLWHRHAWWGSGSRHHTRRGWDFDDGIEQLRLALLFPCWLRLCRSWLLGRPGGARRLADGGAHRRCDPGDLRLVARGARQHVVRLRDANRADALAAFEAFAYRLLAWMPFTVHVTSPVL